MDAPIRLLYVDSTGGAGGIEALFDDDSVSITTVSDGDAAMAVLDDSAIDCVVSASDRSDGLELCKRVRTTAPGVGFVLYPADGDESLASEAIAAGVDGYVPGDASDETLRERIRQAMAGDGPGSTASARPEADHSLLIEQSPIAIIEWDLEFRVADWNPAAEELFGYDRAAALGRRGPELIVPKPVRERIRDGWSGLLESVEGTRYVNENVTADGTTLTCEWHNAPIQENGEVVRVVSFVRDITEERRRSTTVEALQESTPELLRAGSPGRRPDERVPPGRE